MTAITDTPIAGASMQHDNDNVRVDIPADAYVVKAIFDDIPGDDIASDILEHVERTGEPHTWRGHTHNRPRDGSMVYYVEEFSLPVTHAKQSMWAPCPICSPTAPKYRDKGKIAWFPEEKVIRLIGPECFESISGEAHSGALIELRERQEDKRTKAYISEYYSKSRVRSTELSGVRTLAWEMDVFFGALRGELEKQFSSGMWSEMADGTLKVVTEGTGVDEYGETRTIHIRKDFASITGAEVISPNREPLTGRVREISFGMSHDEFSDLMSDTIRARRRAVNKLEDSVAEFEAVKRSVNRELAFLAKQNQETISRWARDEKCPLDVIWESEPLGIRVGRGDRGRLVKMGAELLNATGRCAVTREAA